MFLAIELELEVYFCLLFFGLVCIFFLDWEVYQIHLVDFKNGVNLYLSLCVWGKRKMTLSQLRNKKTTFLCELRIEPKMAKL